MFQAQQPLRKYMQTAFFPIGYVHSSDWLYAHLCPPLEMW